jgi:uncharacterized ferritin-like protein (DUF455 family)
MMNRVQSRQMEQTVNPSKLPAPTGSLSLAAATSLQGASDGATIEAWALDYIRSTSLEDKLAPKPRPRQFAAQAAAVRHNSPGRPAELSVTTRARKTRKGGALAAPARRAELLARFFGHELQAAELFAWAILAFPNTPESFRRGLCHIMDEEIRHMNMYAEELARLGAYLGEFPQRDWFWERVPTVTSASSFVAVMSIGFEGGNLDHGARFEAQFQAAGDAQAARTIAAVHAEEIRHVRFGAHWFPRLSDADDVVFETWRNALPAPLSPILMKGAPIDRKSRANAGLTDVFIDELESWSASGS